jgi:predicted nuclease of predicted toxin-antitoxin system
VRFFFDNCVSIKFVQALSILAQVQGYELVHLTDPFSADTPDEEWIRSLARDGDWVIISGGSENIARSGAEKSVAGIELDSLLLSSG